MRALVLASVLVTTLVSGTAAAQVAGMSPAPRIEVLFVLDSTGSMSSAIREAKTRILEIAESISEGDPRPVVRFGVLTYRDRGDAYVTRRWPLSADWEATRAGLRTIEADGGGDYPESVVQAMHEGIRDTKWDLDQSVMKVIYLIGDAPPKRYDDDPLVDADLVWAAENGIAVHAIGCAGLRGDGREFFERVAQRTEGHYHALRGAERGSGAELVAVRTLEEAEEDERASGRETMSLSDVVKETARTFSAELGVAYEGDELVGLKGEIVAGTVRRDPHSGLLGSHARIVTDAKSWRLLWAAHTSTRAPVPPLPTVDFHEHAVVVLSTAGGEGDVELLGGDGVVVVRFEDNISALLLRHFLPDSERGFEVTMLRVDTPDAPTRVVLNGGTK